MRELDASTFDAAIAGGGPIAVDFWAPWCRPCRAIEAILGELEQELPAVAFAKLNIDEHPEIAARYEVLSIPTVIAFAAGEPCGALIGARPRSHVERWLAEVLPAGELDGLSVQGQQNA